LLISNYFTGGFSARIAGSAGSASSKLEQKILFYFAPTEASEPWREKLDKALHGI
jgi:hypothetical protein